MKKTIFAVASIALFSLMTSSTWANSHYPRHSDHGYRNHYPQRHAYYPPKHGHWQPARPAHHKSHPIISFKDHGKRIKIGIR